MVFTNSNFAELRKRLLTRHYKWVSSHHHPELAVVDLPVPVLVHRPDHLVDLLVGHLNPPPCTMLGSTDGASLTFPGR